MMKNYHLMSWQSSILPTTPNSESVLKDPSSVRNLFKASGKASLFLAFFLMLFMTQEISAQASFYTFAQSNATYTPITGGTVVTTSTAGTPNLDSYVSPSITIPAFTFAGTAYTAMFVTGNGQLALGTTAPSGFNYTVLSSSTGGNVFLAPFSANLDDNAVASEIRYETIGDELVVQWDNFRRSAITESFDFQVRMNTSTGVIKFVYDGTPPYATSTIYPQIGIKSATVSYSALTVAAAGSWDSPTNITSGIVAGSVAHITGSVGPTSGLTYTFTPGTPTVPNCATAFVPADLATDVVRNPTLTWTSGGANPLSYDVYFGPTTNPALIGNQVGTSYMPAFLAANTTYYWKIVPKNATGDATGCIERSFTTGSDVLYCTPSSTSALTFINNFSTTLGSTNISNVSGYTTGGYQDNYSSAAVTAVPTASINFDMAITGGTVGAAIWVDWNSNGTFETTERVFVTTGYGNGPFSGSITVPAGTPVGDYRMRVMTDFNNSAPSNPCMTANARTETEDYKFTVVAQPACSGTPAAATVASSLANICVSGFATLTATLPTSTDSGFTYQWYNTAGPIVGETGTTYTTPVLTAPESYFFKITCTNSGLSADSNTIALGVTNPQVVTTVPGSRCGEGTVNLSATASAGATLNWYAAATGGMALGSGETFTTPSISTTTDFYVAASEGEGILVAGPTSPSAQGGTTGIQTIAWDINFTVHQDTQLTSVDVFPITAGQTSAIALRTSTGTVITTINFTTNVSGGATAQTVMLNFPLTPGNYELYPTLPSGGVTRNTTGAVYPYATSVASITGNGFDPVYYMGMYNWKFTAGCSSARTAVTATITAPPALTLSGTSADICAGASTGTVTLTAGASDYDTFVWSPATGVTGDVATGFVFTPAATTTYTLTATQSAGQLCNADVTFTVNVNELPSALSIVPASTTVCYDTIQALTANGGTMNVDGSTTIGTDTTVTVQGGLEPTAFNNRYEHYWLQMVFTQAELTAAGIQAGSINGIKFNITTIGSAAFVSDYRVKLGATTSDVLTGFISTGLTEVFSAATYNQTIGVNSIVFNTPYVWDGTSNIILDIRSTGADSTNNSSTYYTATTTNKTVSAVTTATFPSSNAYADSNPTGTLSLKRLNTTFDWTSTVATNIVWSPTTDLYADAAATVPYTGTNATTVYLKSQTEGPQTYTVTATIPATGCSTSATATFTTTAATPAPTAIAQTLCSGETVADLEATGTDLEWYNDLTGGTALADTAVLATGDYFVSQTLNGCESVRTLVDVTITPSTATVTRSGDTLTATESGATYEWINCATPSTPIAGATGQSFTVTETGSYAVIVTQNGCVATSECFDVSTLSTNTFDYAKLAYYPNPVTDVLKITHTESISSIQVYDITGRLVKQMNTDDNEVQVDMANMPAAFYIVKVTMGDTSGEFKVIKK